LAGYFEYPIWTLSRRSDVSINAPYWHLADKKNEAQSEQISQLTVVALSALPASGSQPPSQMQRMAGSAGCIAASYQQVNGRFGP